MPRKIGDKVKVRLGFWSDHQTVQATIRKKILFMYLVEWTVQDEDGIFLTARWKPVWRLI